MFDFKSQFFFWKRCLIVKHLSACISKSEAYFPVVNTSSSLKEQIICLNVSLNLKGNF